MEREIYGCLSVKELFVLGESAFFFKVSQQFLQLIVATSTLLIPAGTTSLRHTSSNLIETWWYVLIVVNI